MIRLRFVTCNDAISYMIRAAEDFWASHVEAVMPDGSGYLGAHADGGVAIRPVGYDKATLMRELFVELPATTVQTVAFYDELKQHIGQPYDFEAILGFVTRSEMHSKKHKICSALQAGALNKSWFSAPLCRPTYEISPADLMLILSAQIAIPGGTK